MTLVLERRHNRTGVPWNRTMASWAEGKHWPVPLKRGDGWVCRDCRGRLREYSHKGVRRLRHYR